MSAGDYVLLCCAAVILARGAYTDYKKRLIPNSVPIALAILGLLCMVFPLPQESVMRISVVHRMAGIIPAILMLIPYKRGEAGGGDVKLMAAVGLLVGLINMALLFLVTAILGGLWAACKKTNKIPLALFLFVGFIVWAVVRMVI